MNLVRFRLDLADGVSVGPGKIELLELLDAHGSISAAARAMRISYRKAWLLLDSLNTGFGEHVFDTATGGRRGGGARLTPFGRRLIDRYRKLESAVERLAERAVDDLAPRSAHAVTGARRRPLTRHAASVRRAKRRP